MIRGVNGDLLRKNSRSRLRPEPAMLPRMGRNDRNDRSTRTLDPAELKKLARASAEPQADEDVGDDVGADEVPQSAAVSQQPPPGSRTATLDDPLTAALLAEVTRNTRTQEFDPAELIADLKKPETDSNGNDTPPLPHPALKRR
jgi:hypothetical protein